MRNHLLLEREDSTPAEAGKVGPPIVHLARSRIEDLAEKMEEDEACNLDKGASCEGQALQDDV